ncbi:hypothetical protein [Paenibacillus alba]|uniref:Lipoprotein n=1 Tax=Paenibacillus alba TaxID=1197127 RepID=A0ABU6GB13_9BACL|nr:hypothetical protein [Paenibacillus alba]MEC0229993.1 hypothetical protein [Paenibacillus alba]NQX66200.1 hypothetical protein [Paenibacillus alba]
MIKITLRLLVFLLVTMTIGCSVTHTVHTKSTQSLTKELKQISKTIENVKFTFTRPDLFIEINLKEVPSNEILDSILLQVKAFATIDNMNEIAKSVKWGLEVSEIHLIVNSDKGDQSEKHAYFARYFKTSDASDKSQENMDAYQTWFKEELKNP